MYLWSDFTGLCGERIIFLQIIALIKRREELSAVCRKFYVDYIQNCVSSGKVDCLYSHIVEKAAQFESFTLDYIDPRGIIEFKIDYSDDVFNFLAHDYFLMKNGHVENEDIHKLLNDVTCGYYSDELIYSIDVAAKKGNIGYGSLENMSFFIGPFYINETIEKLTKLDQLITERRYLFKLKGYHQKTHQQFGGFFLLQLVFRQCFKEIQFIQNFYLIYS